MEKAWAIIIDDDQAACMMAIPRLFEQLHVFQHHFLSGKQFALKICKTEIQFYVETVQVDVIKVRDLGQCSKWT
ncbi:hypothetical protein [Endozoicomonas atrinae]|uniref:hypothetical protein n=1 Tax=Endozoicomonas atrinae TaxID=1333660 RepID=UPI003B001AA4